nr:putative Gag-polypeptide of LTR copia-type [Tanacetum cinerariifolium]
MIRFGERGKLSHRYSKPFKDEPLEIMDRKVKRLRHSQIPITKVRWNSQRDPEFMCEHEDEIKRKWRCEFDLRTQIRSRVEGCEVVGLPTCLLLKIVVLVLTLGFCYEGSASWSYRVLSFNLCGQDKAFVKTINLRLNANVPQRQLWVLHLSRISDLEAHIGVLVCSGDRSVDFVARKPALTTASLLLSVFCPAIMTGGAGGSGSNYVLINNLDYGNPLHIQANDNSNIILILFKILGTKNIRIWFRAMKLTLQAKNKEESRRGVHESYGVTESKLNATSFVIKSFNNNRKTFNNDYNNTRGSTSNTINNGPNPNLNCKNCGKIGQTIERCFKLVGFPPCFKKYSNHAKQSFSANADVKSNDKPSSISPSSSCFTFEHMNKLLSLINDNLSGSFHALMACRASFFNDLTKQEMLGNGSDSGGLYLFDMQTDCSLGKSNKNVECSSKDDLVKTKCHTEDPCRDKSVTSCVRAIRFEATANEDDMNVGGASVESLAKRVVDVETSMSDLKERVEVYHQHLEELGSDFSEMREDFKSSLNVLGGNLGCGILDLCGMLIGKITMISSEVEKELISPRRELKDFRANAKAVDDFLWKMEQYMEGVNIVDDASKIKTVMRYLEDTTRYGGDVGMEISNEAKTELERRGVQDLATAIAHAKAPNDLGEWRLRKNTNEDSGDEQGGEEKQVKDQDDGARKPPQK